MDPEVTAPNVEAPLVLDPKILPLVVVGAEPKIEPVLDPNVAGAPNTDEFVDKDGELDVPPKADPNVFVAG